jgi:hypothetical protein
MLFRHGRYPFTLKLMIQAVRVRAMLIATTAQPEAWIV